MNANAIESGTTEKQSRPELVEALRTRDGDVCRYPGEEHPLDFSILEGPQSPTVDHWVPQFYGKANGWSKEQIWALSNLRLMCKKHNARKGDRIPNDDGTLPEKVTRTFRYRRQKRAGRPEFCSECQNGELIAPDEVCANCSMTGKHMPQWAKVRYDECDHELLWCWVCSITPEMRPSSIGIAMRRADSDELGDA